MLGDDADNRRAKQKAAVPRGRYGSDREFGQHVGDLARCAEQDRHGVCESQADRGEAD